MQDAVNGLGVGVPDPGFLVEAPTPGGGQPIILRFALVLRESPLGLEQAFVFEAPEGGVEGAVLNLDAFAGGVLDAFDDGIPVERTGREGAEDQHVERAG